MGLRDAVTQLGYDVIFLFVKFMFFWSIWFAFRTTESDAFSLFSGKGLFRAHADEIAFNFCGQTECKCKDFAGNVVSKAIVVLYAPHVAALSHADAENFHYHEEISAESGQFCTDYNVSFMDTFEQFAKLTFAVSSCSADGFLNPSINHEFFASTETVDFESLVFDGLLVAADPNVTIYHVNLPPLISNVKTCYDHLVARQMV